MRLRNQQFFSLAELNAVIVVLVVDLNERPMRKQGISVQSILRYRLDRQPAAAGVRNDELGQLNRSFSTRSVF